MRFVLLVACVLVSACGSVKSNNTPDGAPDDDAATCGGTVMNGECVCPARFVAPACTECAPGWSGPSCANFTDNFNRAAGALGPQYADIQVGLAEDALIVNSRACGDVQAIGILEELIDSTSVSATLIFDPGNIDGQEFSFLLSSDPTLGSAGALFVAGCDGGGAECTLRISPGNGAPLAERTLNGPVPAGSRASLITDGSGNIRVEILVNGITEQVSAQLPVGYVVQRLGFIAGREPDGTLSCIDDLAVQVN